MPHRDLADHPMGEAVKRAEVDHLKSHEAMNSWTEGDASDPRAAGQRILDCMWVYVYKFDRKGQYLKSKARIVVRGDQQGRDQQEETYAAMLAARSFRTLMAICALFDLEMIQYDAINAFVNAEMPEGADVFMRMPTGHRKHGRILRLNKALYGLRISPLLWQRELSTTLKALGLREV